ncbi:hypothetical protein T492DRAFT_839336 [Pavlovales sp. CCMP2436]|nr:hypothetical protein T492DRAFT_839336 [Pavlovales sp. CCMP2436]
MRRIIAAKKGVTLPKINRRYGVDITSYGHTPVQTRLSRAASVSSTSLGGRAGPDRVQKGRTGRAQRDAGGGFRGNALGVLVGGDAHGEDALGRFSADLQEGGSERTIGGGFRGDAQGGFSLPQETAEPRPLLLTTAFPLPSAVRKWADSRQCVMKLIDMACMSEKDRR